MRFPRRCLLFLALFGLPFAGCKKGDGESDVLRGSGVQATKTRTIAPFSRLEVGDRIQAFVRFGSHAPMEVKCDDNLVAHVRSRIENGVMRIDMDTKVKGKMPIEVRLTTPALESITGTGVSRIYIEGLAAKDFQASVKDTSRIVAEGTADTLSFEGKDVSELDFTKVLARSAKIHLVKASTARVGYVEDLDVRISDVARVFYEGEPNIKKDVKRPAFMVKTR